MPEALWIAVLAVLIVALGWAAYRAIGPQALGLPVIIGVLVVAAGASIFSNAGIVGLLAIVVGLAAVVVVIGMAMNVGSTRSQEVRPNTPPKRD